MRSTLTSTLDACTRAAWQAQIAAANKTAGLLPHLVRQRHELLPRFAAVYTQLRALPRRIRRTLQRRWKKSLAGLALWLALGQSPALAATISVNATCMLVDVITAANTDSATGGCPAGSGADTIVLPANSTQTLTSVNNDTYGPTGLPVISSPITIEGQGSSIVREESAPEFRILAVNGTGDLTLNETTVSGGVAPAGTFSDGGGVANYGGTLTLANSTITGNRTTFFGGGVFNIGILTITNSTIAGNFAASYGGPSPTGEGGGVWNDGTVIVKNSTITGNQSSYSGGGVFNSGTFSVTNSTISGNFGGGSGYGGGVFNSGTFSVTNSTISDNFSSYPGGGVWNVGTLTLANSTITGNRISFFVGGGVWNGGTLTLARTLVSGNTTFYGAPEIANSGMITADSYNLFGFNGDAGVEGFSPGPTDIVPGPGIQLSDILDPTLANNGGPTLTHALVPGSPALDATPASNPGCGGTDQRGVPRPQGAGCDIGAVEFTTGVVPLTVTIDIRPGLPGNRLPLDNPATTKPVAILSTETFGALTVDPTTVRFGVTGTEAAPRHVARNDVNGDGRPDLIVRFRLGETGIECGDTEAFLTGETVEGQAIEGSDAIHTVKCP